MPKYATNPGVMTGDLGVFTGTGGVPKMPAVSGPAAPMASSMPALPGMEPRRRLPGIEPPPDGETGGTFPVPTTCLPYDPLRFQFLSRRGGFVVKTDNWGKKFMCPPNVEPPQQPDTTPGEGLGEFGWSSELADLYQLLLSRGGEFLGDPGFSDQALSYAFGNDFEKIRAQEAAKRQQLLDTQSRMGTLGSGSSAGQLSDLAWGTEGDIATLMRDIFLQNEGQKRQDVQLGAGLFGQGAGFEQMLEAINAARRGEGSQALQQLLMLLQILKGGG